MNEENSGCQPLSKRRQRFWFCYVDGKGTPAHKHYSLADAQKEAERLVKQNHLDVFVMDAQEVARYVPPTPPPDVEWQITIK